MNNLLDDQFFKNNITHSRCSALSTLGKSIVGGNDFAESNVSKSALQIPLSTEFTLIAHSG